MLFGQRELQERHPLVRVCIVPGVASPLAAATLPLRPLLLVGNPNVGKSLLFTRLTNRYVTVSNYPGTTVEVTRGSGVLERAL